MFITYTVFQKVIPRFNFAITSVNVHRSIDISSSVFY